MAVSAALSSGILTVTIDSTDSVKSAFIRSDGTNYIVSTTTGGTGITVTGGPSTLANTTGITVNGATLGTESLTFEGSNDFTLTGALTTTKLETVTFNRQASFGSVDLGTDTSTTVNINSQMIASAGSITIQTSFLNLAADLNSTTADINLKLGTGGLALANNLTAADDVRLETTGAISQTAGIITAVNLSARSQNDVSLTRNNLISTNFAAAARDVTFNNASTGLLTIGAVSSITNFFGTNGLGNSGVTTINAAGALSVTNSSYSTGGLNFNSGGVMTLNALMGASAGTVRFVAVGGVNQAGGLISGANLSARNSGTGDIHLLGLNLNAGALIAASNTASGGAVNLDNFFGSGFFVDTVTAGPSGFAAVTGITTNNGDVNIKYGPLTINQAINAGTGTVRIGSEGGVSQTATGIITAAGLGLRNWNGGTIDLTGAANHVDVLAADGTPNGGSVIKYRDADALTLGTISSGVDGFGTATGIITTSNNVTIVSGALSINQAVNIGTGTLRLATSGGVTGNVSAVITASSLGISNSTSGNIDLTTATTSNVANFVAANAASGGSIKYRDTDALSISSVSADGAFFNAVDNLATTNGDITLVSGALTINQAVAAGTGTVRISASGSITQSSTGSITGSSLGLRATAGNVDLTTSTANNVATLSAVDSAAGGFVKYRDADGFAVGSVSADGTLFTATNGISTANGGSSTNGAAATTGNDVTLVGGAIAVNQAINAGTATVRMTAAGGVSQTSAGVITASSFGVRNATSGDINLTGSSGNHIGTFAAFNAAVGAALTYTPADVTTVGTVSADGSLFSQTVGVTRTNAAPVLAINSGSSLVQGGTVVVTSGMLSTTDVDNTASQLTYQVVTAPTHGTLRRNGVQLSGGGTFTQADVNAGIVTYTNDASGGTSDGFTFIVGDGTVSLSQANFTFTVSQGNAAPSFTKGSDQSVLNNAGAQTVANWATNISAGLNEGAQSLAFQVSTDNPSLFTVAPAISSNGTLTYTPSGVLGTAVVTVVLKDSGGTANGGIDASPAQTFSIQVTATPVAGAGSLDPTYDGDGIRQLTSPQGAADQSRDVAVQADGKLLVLSSTYTGGTVVFANTTQLSRYNTDGTLDTTFAVGGTFTWADRYRLTAIEILSDGKILLAGDTTLAGGLYITRLNADGSLDSTFGTAGVAGISIGNVSIAPNDTVGMTVQSDGRIVLVRGYRTTLAGNMHFAVARLTAAGAADTTFNSTGVATVTVSASQNEYPIDVAVQSDGKIVVAGVTNLGAGAGTDFIALRFTAAGALDASFNTVGYNVVNVSASASGSDTANRVVIQSDGKIVLGGAANSDFGLVRFNTDGSLDTTFDGDGKVTTNINGSDQIFGLAQRSDGTIVAAGTGNGGLALARYTSQGALDVSFDGDGKATFSIASSSQINAISLQSDEKIVFAGTSSDSLNAGDVVFGRFNSNGSIDTTFNGVGYGSKGITPGSARITSSLQLSDGRVLLGGFLVEINSNIAGRRAVWRLLADGSLDTSFGTGGVSLGTSLLQTAVSSLLVQGDGKILVLDSTQSRVTRLNADGSVDTSFGAGGTLAFVPTYFTSPNGASSMALLGDGKILIAGAKLNSGTSLNEFAVVRVTSAGAIDTTFDSDGLVTIDVGAGADFGRTIAVQSDGKVLVGGYASNGTNDDFALVRLNADGTLDTSFGGTGKVVKALGSGADQARSMVLQDDGKIVLAGQSSSDFGLVRFLADGTVDSSFGTAGVVVSQLSTGTDDLFSLVRQADGKYLAVGYATATSVQRIAVARYLSNGTLDSAFGSAGVTLTTVGTNANQGQTAYLQSDGKLVVGGFADGNATTYPTILRYLTAALPGGPTIVSVADQTTNEDVAKVVDFAVSHPTLPAGSLNVTVASGNTTLAPNGGLSLTNLGNGNWRLTATPAANLSGSALITLTASDGTNSYAETFTLTVNAVNDAPVVDLNGGSSGAGYAATFTEDGGPVAITDAANLSLIDIDSTTLAGATVTITNLPDGAAETLTANVAGTSLSAAYLNGVLTISGVGAVAEYQQVLRTVAYNNSSQAPTTTARQITFTVTDGAATSLAATSVVTITPVNDAPTAGANLGLTLAEGATATLDGTRLKTNDVDNTAAQLVYTVTNLPAHGTVNLNGVALSANGTFTQADLDAGRISYTHDSSENFADSFQFTVSDGEYPLSEATFSFTITPVNDAPVVAPQSFILYNKAVAGTIVGAVQASDRDAGQQRSFALLGGNGALAINAATGVLTVVNSKLLVGAALNFVVRVTDDGVPPLATDAAISVSLRAADTPPTFAVVDGASAPLGVVNNQVKLALDERTDVTATRNGLVVAGLTASDVDEPGVVFPLVMTDRSGAFAFDAATGTLSIRDASKLDYEKTRSFTLTFTAVDHGLVGLPKPVTSTLTMTVQLIDRNDAPTVTPTATFKLKENNGANTVVGTVTAADVDGLAAFKNLQYGIVSQRDAAGNDVGIFSIDAARGTLKIVAANALNYEVQPQYTVVVRARDAAGLFADQTVTVQVIDVNEAVVLTLLDAAQNPATGLTVPENTANGTLVGYLRIDNPDVTRAETFKITLNDNLGKGFAVGAFDAASRLAPITVFNATKLNYEALKNGQFTLSFSVSDSGFTSNDGSRPGPITVNKTYNSLVTDVNEAPTAVTFRTVGLPGGSAPIPAGTLFGTALGVDPDKTPQAFTYSLTPGYANNDLFTIDPSTGQLRSNLALGRRGVFNIQIRVADAGGLAFNQNFVVRT